VIFSSFPPEDRGVELLFFSSLFFPLARDTARSFFFPPGTGRPDRCSRRLAPVSFSRGKRERVFSSLPISLFLYRRMVEKCEVSGLWSRNWTKLDGLFPHDWDLVADDSSLSLSAARACSAFFPKTSIVLSLFDVRFSPSKVVASPFFRSQKADSQLLQLWISTVLKTLCLPTLPPLA